MNLIRLRNAIPEDMARIRKLHASQNERDGTRYPLPQLFTASGDRPSEIPVALVGEEDGTVVQAVYVQRTAELMFAGCDPRATAVARRDIDPLAQILTWQGYGDLYCHVPIAMADAIQTPLMRAGFKCLRDDFVSFYKDLRVKP